MKSNIAKLLAIGAMAASGSLWAGDVFVIAHPGVNVSAEDVRDIFVGEKQLDGNVKLVPMDNSTAQADFLAKVVKVDGDKYKSLWAKKGFRDGLSPPPVRGGDAEVISAVKSTPGGIGYVTKASGDVKVIQKY